MQRSRLTLTAIAIFVAACATPSGDTTGGDNTRVVEEARAFMDEYAKELLAGNRAAIAARYDRTGAYMLGNGVKLFEAHDAIAAKYAGSTWNAPSAFEWIDLSFEPIGTDAMVVVGRFRWVSATPPADVIMSYTSLLRRQDGVLRIRVEDESMGLPDLPRPPRPDSTKR